MKIINVIRAVIFLITLSISSYIFLFYMSFELDNYSFYSANNLIKESSDEIKDLAGLSELSFLKIEGYSTKVSFSTDYRDGGNVLFSVILPGNELSDFRNYVEAFMNQPDSREHPRICICENSLQLKEGMYRMKIEYFINKNSKLFSYLLQTGKMHFMSSALIRVLSQFWLLLMINCLILFPYKKFILLWLREGYRKRDDPNRGGCNSLSHCLPELCVRQTHILYPVF